MAAVNTGYHTSLLTAIDCRGHVHLIVGTNPLAASRCGQSLGAGARPILISPTTSELHYALQRRIDSGEVKWLRKAFEDSDLTTLGREEVDCVVDAVFVTSGPRDALGAHVSALCRRKRIPVNVVDAPALCSFSILSTHTDGPLQIGVTTNGRGCKLASRIRREVAAGLPSELGSACARLGDVRRRIQEEDVDGRLAGAKGPQKAQQTQQAQSHADDSLDDSYDQSAAFNRLVTEADLDAAKNRRMRWLSQVCEYWPLKRLAAISNADVDAVLESYAETQNRPAVSPGGSAPSSGNSSRGRIILAGSGPGHPDLLTRATYKAIQAADLVLADKLVPAGVLDLVPRRTPVSIARKFPGNADAAQEELLEQALAGVRAGKVVLRLKQGDPFVYGRGGEEVARFREAGLADRVVVLPGLTSALTAPLFAGIPTTQRDVADQVLVCTGTGKKGRPPSPPGFVASRTVVFLMALHRIVGLVRELTCHTEEEELGILPRAEARRDDAVDTGKVMETVDEKRPPPTRALWPKNTPCAVVERASCPDQRVIRTTLEFVAQAIEQEGSRPPGLLVVGRACEALYTMEKGRSWAVEDGFKGLDLDELAVPQAPGLLAE